METMNDNQFVEIRENLRIAIDLNFLTFPVVIYFITLIGFPVDTTKFYLRIFDLIPYEGLSNDWWGILSWMIFLAFPISKLNQSCKQLDELPFRILPLVYLAASTIVIVVLIMALASTSSYDGLNGFFYFTSTFRRHLLLIILLIYQYRQYSSDEIISEVSNRKSIKS